MTFVRPAPTRRLAVVALALVVFVIAFVLVNASEVDLPVPGTSAQPLERHAGDRNAAAVPDASEVRSARLSTEEGAMDAVESASLRPESPPEEVRVYGKVLDSVTREPMPYFPLLFTHEQEGPFAVDTDSNGAFALDHLFPQSMLAVEVRGAIAQSEFVLDLVDFALLADQPQGWQPVELRATRPDLVLEILAIHPDPNLASTVEVLVAKSTSSASRRTNAQGVVRFPFMFGSVKAAPVVTSAFGEGGYCFGPLVLEPPITKGPHELFPSLGAELELTVLSKGGIPLASAEVSLHCNTSSRRILGDTDERGHLMLDGLFPGDYDVTVTWSARYASATITVEPDAATSTAVWIDVARQVGRLATGRVVDDQGRGMSGMAVRVLDRITRTNDDGTFQVWGEPTTWVTVEPFAPGCRFEPQHITTAPGSSGLMFRRLPAETPTPRTVEATPAVFFEPNPDR